MNPTLAHGLAFALIHAAELARTLDAHAQPAGAISAARVDPEVFRVFSRRIGLPGRTGVLDVDLDLRRRIEQEFSGLRAIRLALVPGRVVLGCLA